MRSDKLFVIKCCAVMLGTSGVPLNRITIINSSCCVHHAHDAFVPAGGQGVEHRAPEMDPYASVSLMESLIREKR